MVKKIARTRHFRVVFHQRIRFNPTILALFYEKLSLLLEGKVALIRSHELKGSMLTLKAFSLTDDVRVIYKETHDTIILVDVGTHKQVYKK